VAKPAEEAPPQNDNGETAGKAPAWSTVDLGWLAPAVLPGPSFPTDVLPQQVGATVKAFADERRISPDFLAGALIGAGSAAIGNRARVLGYDGATEPANTFVALVGWPGTGKSLALSVAEAPLMRIEDALQEGRDGQGPKVSAMARGFRDSVKESLAHEGMEPRDEDEHRSPSSPSARLLLSEFSVAGLLDELQGDAGGRAVLVDELTGALAGSSGQAGLKARALLLQGYDGKPYRKRTATAGLIHVPALQISILGGTQPDRVPAIVGRARDGLAPRFLWIAPEIDPIAAMAKGSGPTADLEAALLRMIRIEPFADGARYAREIVLSEAARAPLEAAGGRWIEKQKGADPVQRDFLSRARQHSIRLGTVNAQLEHSLSGKDGAIAELSAGDIERAIALVDNYFLPMGQRTFDLAGSPRDTDAKRLARYLRRLGRRVISVRDDLHRGPGSPTKSPAAAAEAIAELRARGLVREAARDPEARGRPSVSLEVHPDLLKS